MAKQLGKVRPTESIGVTEGRKAAQEGTARLTPMSVPRYGEDYAPPPEEPTPVGLGAKTLGIRPTPIARKPNQEFTPLEISRLGLAGVDIGSTIASFVPGAHFVATGAGVASSLGTAVADYNDPAMDGWDVAKNLGANLGLDALSLIPVGKVGKAAKALRGIGHLLPKALALYGSVGNGALAKSAYDKYEKGGFSSISAEEWQALANVIQLAAGGGKHVANKLSTVKIPKLEAKFPKIFRKSTPGAGSSLPPKPQQMLEQFNPTTPVKYRLPGESDVKGYAEANNVSTDAARKKLMESSKSYNYKVGGAIRRLAYGGVEEDPYGFLGKKPVIPMENYREWTNDVQPLTNRPARPITAYGNVAPLSYNRIKRVNRTMTPIETTPTTVTTASTTPIGKKLGQGLDGALDLVPLLFARKAGNRGIDVQDNIVRPAVLQDTRGLEQNLATEARIASTPETSDAGLNLIRKKAVNSQLAKQLTEVNQAKSTDYNQQLDRVAQEQNQNIQQRNQVAAQNTQMANQISNANAQVKSAALSSVFSNVIARRNANQNEDIQYGNNVRTLQVQDELRGHQENMDLLKKQWEVETDPAKKAQLEAEFKRLSNFSGADLYRKYNPRKAGGVIKHKSGGSLDYSERLSLDNNKLLAAADKELKATAFKFTQLAMNATAQSLNTATRIILQATDRRLSQIQRR